MDWGVGLAGLAAGLLIAVFTAPVGVSGAVFLLPVQLSVFAIPGPAVFKGLVAVFLLPLGVWLITRTLLPPRQPKPPGDRPSARTVTGLALAVGVVGGIYGIGGGSLLGPILVGRGMPVAKVAPAALASTFATSVVGAETYALLALTDSGSIAPHWFLGLACGLGGLIGGYLGARLQPRLPEKTLRLLLGSLAASVGALYAVESLG
ncbi:TSUP family transporter [Streptomyces sp. NPDC020817]|uniref:TSUP family transporter n=1 Tax=Streptomyces sp. NPDC020817 TaxID=3365095 RepID=UPI00378D27B3